MVDDTGRVGAAFHAYAGSAPGVAPLHKAHPDAPLRFTEKSGSQAPPQAL